ncbi:arogenate dehydrogenase 1, chloroplastic [Neltuma alba]|uniref:arogenate dehydrogenase 1, chloroplastic n=1 Tax=Neltuma alba TaxID=207710 RepID=UPI0010A359A2|nr:arogenate dehydrogenase 1, chloroplastic-like [Prosopis alba]XP_028807291.1 arogenate dehydrogenase 1, chloroplastic-like [Prosopis alba]XP_028807292.1 arogenate dehydrogenase 1, chloroplastic-like [Prosopis alba]
MLSVSNFYPSPVRPKPALHYSPLGRQRPWHFSIPPSLDFNHRSFSLRQSLCIRSIDAAQLYDYESKLAVEFQNAQKLKIAIIGFGNFGQFLAKTLRRQGHNVLAHSRSDYSDVARKLGVSFFPDPNDLCEEHPEIILLCTSIISTEQVVLSLPLQRLKRSTLVVDVLSVKEFPKNVLLEALPSDFDIICTHPMFGPESAGHGWSGLTFMYDIVRIGDEDSRIARCEKFLNIFSREGCRMVEMTCADHDRYAAESQFITHTVGRVLDMLMLGSTPINTKGYESLLELVVNTSGDSFDLYYGLFMFNKNSLEMLERLDLAFDALRKQLIGRLHDVVRNQLFENAGKMQNGNHAVFNNAQNVSSRDTRFHDVAQTYSFKSNNSSQLDGNSKLKIAVIGFGNFGQFLAKTMVRQGHEVLAYSRTNYSDVAQELGVSYFNDADDLCEQHPEVILICTSILSTEKVLKSLPVQRLKRSTLFVDVLSVKEFPRNLFLQHLPADFDILCTHPMFGPESGKNGWKDLPFVFDSVRVGNDELRMSRCERFLDIFVREGCRMVDMSCAEHDWHAAGSQFITHTMGRILEKLGLVATPINTKGYETLLSLVENTAGDSFDLYYGLFMYNINAMEQLERLDLAFESLKKQLFGRLHSIYRKQLFENTDKLHALPDRLILPEMSEEGKVVSSFSEVADVK